MISLFLLDVAFVFVDVCMLVELVKIPVLVCVKVMIGVVTSEVVSDVVVVVVNVDVVVVSVVVVEVLVVEHTAIEESIEFSNKK